MNSLNKGDVVEDTWNHGDTITYKVKCINGSYKIINQIKKK